MLACDFLPVLSISCSSLNGLKFRGEGQQFVQPRFQGPLLLAVGLFPLFNMADQMGSDSLLNQAESMWKMLDDMADSDPDAYKKFIDKALKDGATSLKPPEPCFCISTILVSMATSTFTSLVMSSSSPQHF